MISSRPSTSSSLCSTTSPGITGSRTSKRSKSSSPGSLPPSASSSRNLPAWAELRASVAGPKEQCRLIDEADRVVERVAEVEQALAPRHHGDAALVQPAAGPLDA